MTTPASKNAQKKRGKPFEAGHAGGPGRPAGSRNKATLALGNLADGDAKAILQKQLDKAKEDDARSNDFF
jgi:hypothetical protein